jgi:thiol-disulfide isomerase/thioredoxin
VRRTVLILSLAVASLAAACSSGTIDPTFVKVSGPMPAVAGTTLDGRSFGPSDYRGKVVVVNFWNQDCPPCREEQPVLESVFSSLGSRGVTVIGMLYVGGNWPNDQGAAQRFLQENGVTYPNLLDSNSQFARGFRIAGIPTTVVVDRTGQLRFQLLGKVRPGQLEDLIDQLD